MADLPVFPTARAIAAQVNAGTSAAIAVEAALARARAKRTDR